ncbi:MAG: hypothetical protein ACE5F1_20490 [Planctomycetota bacterium]
MKFDHVELTGVERDSEGRLCPDIEILREVIKAGARTCGGCERSKRIAELYDATELAAGLPTELGIMLLYDDLELNFPNRLAYYRGRTAYCTGDGAQAERLRVIGRETVNGREVDVYGERQPYGPCGPGCPDFEARRCKPMGRLRFVLGLQASVGGCYEYRTTSWNSISNLQKSLELIQSITGGVLRWIPLWFSVVPQTVQPKDGRRANTAWIAQITYRGTPPELLEQVRDQLKLQAPVLHEIRQLEASLSRDWTMTPEEVTEFREEFDPENLAEEEASFPSGPVNEPEAEIPEAPGPNPEPEPDDEPWVTGVDPPAEPPTFEGEPIEPEPQVVIGVEQKQELWAACKARAAQLPVSDEQSAAKILLNALASIGCSKSDEVLVEDFARLLAAVQNASGS